MTLVLTGLESEAHALARALEIPRLGRADFVAFGRGRLRMAAVGLGAGRLDARWDAMAGDGPVAQVVSAGVCGGLDPALRPGDLIVPQRVLAPGGEVLDVSPAMRRAILDRIGPVPAAAILATSDRVLSTPEAKADLRARTGAAAVDMESAAVMRRAAAAGAAALVVRGVSDAAGETVPAELLEVMSPDGHVRAVRALAALVFSPRLVGDALRLRRDTRRALGAVASALRGLPAVRE